jgi:hypothetical protein
MEHRGAAKKLAKQDKPSLAIGAPENFYSQNDGVKKAPNANASAGKDKSRKVNKPKDSDISAETAPQDASNSPLKQKMPSPSIFDDYAASQEKVGAPKQPNRRSKT